MLTVSRPQPHISCAQNYLRPSAIWGNTRASAAHSGDSGSVRRKILQDYANKVCEMFVGWRLAVSGDDIPRLIEAGSGVLDVNLLDASVLLDGTNVPAYGIVNEVAAWLRDRCEADRVPFHEIQEARVRVAFSASEVDRKGHRVRELHFQCRSQLVTDERVYEGVTDKHESWVGSSEGAPWVVEQQ